MTRFKTSYGVLAAALALAAATPATAAEEALIPPGNSAVNQYTESFPTSGGNKRTEKRSTRPAERVLGKKNTERLESHGADGREVAEVAAETAPVAVDDGGPDSGSEAGAGAVVGGSGGQGSGGDTGSTAAGTDTPERQTARADGVETSVARPEGSSAFSEVLAQATGSSDSGETGLLLPLVIVTTLAASAAYALRRRRIAAR
ncbi:MAG TPA: hypothetical protein VHF50_05835 [Solirubrobacterales bacterium]|nr:hypothetical protein [Solirubrobacterales bacterium]